MTDPENNFSRLNRKKGRKRADKILNVLIAAVVVAIIITAIIIFGGGNDEVNKKNEEDSLKTEKTKENASKDNNEVNDADADLDKEDVEDAAGDLGVIEDEEDESGVVTYLYPDDEIIEQSIVDPSWKPIGTTQTGDHVSVYDENSVDWKEKQEAIADATGLSIENTTIWRLQNGGSPQKSIGIVSSKDKAEKYRVYLEWVEDEGWKTVKMDVLKTLDFDYKSSN